MKELNARLRVGGMTDDEARALPIQLSDEVLGSMPLSTWMTDAGGLDILDGLAGRDGRVIPYAELVPRMEVLRPAPGFTVRAAALDDIITAKERANRDKDRAALPALRRQRDLLASNAERAPQVEPPVTGL